MDYIFPFDRTIDLKAFIEDVRECENQVYFESTEGDKLALRSALCQFILYSICNQPQLIKGAVIRCFGEHDRQLLLPYFDH